MTLGNRAILVAIMALCLGACVDQAEIDDSQGRDAGGDDQVADNGDGNGGGGGGGGGGEDGSSSDDGGGSQVGMLRVSWTPNPPGDNVLGYAVFYGPGPDDTDTELTRLDLSAPEFNPVAPTLDYDLDALGLQPGDQLCVRVKAYNGSGDSGFSVPSCTAI